MEHDLDAVEEAVIRRYTRGINSNDRDDVQQTIRLKWLRCRRKYPNAGMGLLVTVSRRTVSDLLRARKCACSLHKPLKDDGSRTVQPLDLIVSSAPPPHERADARDLIRHLMRQLSPRERQLAGAVATTRNLSEAALRCGMRHDAMRAAVSRLRRKMETRRHSLEG
jgi:DNA-directed RNA polymerase specialized sigma24 family protein